MNRKSAVTLLLVALALASSLSCDSVEYTDLNSAVLVPENAERRLEKINGKYKLGATDGISVTVPSAPNLSGGQTIRPDGNVTIDMLGDIYLEGMTPMQAADVLTKALQVYIREVDVTVRVTGFNSKKYYMFGETNSVGMFVFDGDVTILSAFGTAKGVTNRAAWDRIRLVRATRNTRQIFKVNLADIIKTGQWETNIQLKTNDIVYVPPTYFARVGYFIDNLLFPFRSLMGAMWTFSNMGGAGGGGGAGF